MEGLKEKIGNVILDYSQYPGQDFYSEGAEEDLLLETVKNHTAEEYNRLIAENARWSMLYHLSGIRGNIVDFIHLENASVLEVGAGCGAITGTLASKASKVTCIELSKKRSLINAYRNQSCENIEIKVGNFQDIEKKLDEKYDYIMLIGVFEYAASYIADEHPYETFLEILKSHLKDGGRIVMAIENKYGLKYLAGCKEDHTGRMYEGIEGYHHSSGVRTFSLRQLQKLSKSADLQFTAYYPYPDYKLPFLIYSEEKMPAIGELQQNLLNFDDTRIVAFDEGKAIDELITEGSFPYFSNSFLLFLQKGERVESFCVRKTVYSKHSNDRSPFFAIRTDLEKDGYGNYYVVKYPFGKQALAHIEALETYFEQQKLIFEGSAFTPNRCKRIEVKTTEKVAMEFEYLSGKTMEATLDCLLETEKTEEVKELLNQYMKELEGLHGLQPFKITDDFIKVFGQEKGLESEKCLKITNLDLIFSNIIMNDGWNVIDYEWTFSFPIPLSFVKYRALYYYFTGKKKTLLTEWNLYKQYGITEEMRALYERMEQHFQQWISGEHFSLIRMHSIFGRDAVKLDLQLSLATILPRKDKVKVYFDYGDGFSENNTCFYIARQSEEDKMELSIPLTQRIKNVRIDPADDSCMLMLHSCTSQEVLVNGILLPNQIILFDTKDPQIILEQVESFQEIQISYTIMKCREDFFQAISMQIQEGNRHFLNPSTIIKKRGPYEKVRVSRETE